MNLASLLRWHAVVLGLLGVIGTGSVFCDEPDAVGIEFFEKHIRPILVQHCFECHGPEKTKGGLRLDSRAGWSAGGDSGPAIIPGKPDDSLLIQAIRYGGDYEMPPKGKLPAELIKKLEHWVQIGAPDPRVSSTADASKPNGKSIDLEAGRRHWAYRPLNTVSIPSVRAGTWAQNEIDNFILARLEAASLQPSADADRTVLVRRLYFDLHGLLPTPEEIDAFLRDDAPDAYTRLVERLLASPRFGERWGRHWLDVARFAESMTLRGFVFKEAWRYRDYVIQTLNEDRPYDAFVREQIAGDLLPAADRFDRERKLVATSLLAMGNTNLEEQDKKQLEMDVIDEQLDVISKGFLAQTLTCARCHDHKFDPIPQRDYYALAGILRNTKALEHANVSKWIEAPLPVEPQAEQRIKQHETAIAALEKQIKRAKEAVKLASTKKTNEVPSPQVLSTGELPGIVVDDSQAKRVGEWQESQFTKRYIGSGYLHDMKRDQGNKTLTFSPELPRDGQYEVRLAYSPGESRAKAANVTVFSADGEKTIAVDETEPPSIDGRFVTLGRFRFERAGQSFVIVSNEQADGYVTADAVQFLPTEIATDAASAGGSTEKRKPNAAQAQLTAAESELKRLEADMKTLTAAAPPRPMAMSVLELPELVTTRLNIRGVVHNLGEEVPRGFLQVCSDDAPVSFPANQSGRVELAMWLTSPTNPLPARVIVNRVWHKLFGSGIVRTVDNFGLTGETPSHPELLDFLAEQFVRRGWSIKDLVREMVLSRTYCQTSNASPADSRQARVADPENRLLWCMSRRRVDAEFLRDAMLFAAGRLNLEMGGPSFKTDLASDYGFQHTGTRRSIYEPVFRNALPEIYDAFDFADPSVVTGRRSTSTVAPQALFLMNHPFVLEQSQFIAQRLLAESTWDDSHRIDFVFRTTLGRFPSAEEKQAAVCYLANANAESVLRRWSQLCQSLVATIDFRYVQ